MFSCFRAIVGGVQQPRMASKAADRWEAGPWRDGRQGGGGGGGCREESGSGRRRREGGGGGREEAVCWKKPGAGRKRGEGGREGLRRSLTAMGSTLDPLATLCSCTGQDRSYTTSWSLFSREKRNLIRILHLSFGCWDVGDEIHMDSIRACLPSHSPTSQCDGGQCGQEC